jgi:predicted PurR-regulated permease PerM
MVERKSVAGTPVRGPTPIRVSRAVWNLIVLSIIAALLLIVWAVPVVLIISLGGFAVALVLSFPVQLFSRLIPRDLAILLSFLILLAALLLVFYVLIPLLLTQVGALISALPSLIQNLERYLIGVLEAMDRRDLLPSPPEVIAARLGEDLRASIGVVTSNVLGGTVGFVFGTFSFALTLFAIIFVAASLLSNLRNFKLAYLTCIPGRYRYDGKELWDALAYALSRYLGGLALVLAIQGVLAAMALYRPSSRSSEPGSARCRRCSWPSRSRRRRWCSPPSPSW